jgi:hypothetical protein
MSIDTETGEPNIVAFADSSCHDCCAARLVSSRVGRVGFACRGGGGSYPSAYSEIPELLERDLVLDDDAGILDTPGSPCNPRKATDGRAQVWIQSALRNYRYFLRSSSGQLGPTNGRVERGNNTLLKPAELKSLIPISELHANSPHYLWGTRKGKGTASAVPLGVQRFRL